MKQKNKSFEETCSVFIKTVNHYFSHLTSDISNTGIPYIRDKDALEFNDFTGLISISGNKKGFLYITGDTGLYQELIMQFIGLDTPTKEDLLDMAGELSNVVAGNLRETFGNDFIISVPSVFSGEKKGLIGENSKTTPFIIPILWRSHKAHLVIGID